MAAETVRPVPLSAAPGLYKYDVQLKVASGEDADVYTPLRGALRLLEDQTREVM